MFDYEQFLNNNNNTLLLFSYSLYSYHGVLEINTIPNIYQHVLFSHIVITINIECGTGVELQLIIDKENGKCTISNGIENSIYSL